MTAVLLFCAGGSVKMPMANNPLQQWATMPPVAMPIVFQGLRLRCGGVGCQALVGGRIGPLWRCRWRPSITQAAELPVMIGGGQQMFGPTPACAESRLSGRLSGR